MEVVEFIACFQTPSWQLTNCVIQGKLLNLSELLLHISKGRTKSCDVKMKLACNPEPGILLVLVKVSCYCCQQRNPSIFHEYKETYCSLLRTFGNSNYCCLFACLFVCFQGTALLRYNSYTLQLTYLKCPLQWLLLYSQSCDAITTSLEPVTTAQETPYSPVITLQSLLCPSPKQPLILSLQICLFGTFHMNRII